MKNLHLKIVHSTGHTGSPRLCETCAHGLVLRGEGMEFTYCGYMREYVSVRVESCNRYMGLSLRDDETLTPLLAHYTLD